MAGWMHDITDGNGATGGPNGCGRNFRGQANECEVREHRRQPHSAINRAKPGMGGWVDGLMNG